MWAITTWAGLSLFIAALENDVPLHAARPHVAVAFVVSAVVLAVVAAGSAHRARIAASGGFLLASAAGILYGLTAGLIKIVIIQAASGPLAVLSHWSCWAALIVGANALLLSQRAYHAARLPITMPILNIADVLVAIVFGIVVFGERIFSSPLHLFTELVGLLILATGVWQPARQEEKEIEIHQVGVAGLDSVEVQSDHPRRARAFGPANLSAWRPSSPCSRSRPRARARCRP